MSAPELTPEQEANFPKIGCVQHDCDKCKTASSLMACQQAKIDALTAELAKEKSFYNEEVAARLLDQLGAMKTDRDSLLAERDALQAQVDELAKQEPVGWANPLHVGVELTTLWVRKEAANDAPLYAKPVPASPAELVKLSSDWSEQVKNAKSEVSTWPQSVIEATELTHQPIYREGCNYLARQGTVCNKCGEIHQ